MPGKTPKPKSREFIRISSHYDPTTCHQRNIRPKKPTQPVKKPTASTTTGGVTTTFTNSLFGSITRTTGGAAGNTEYVRDNTGNLMAIQNGGSNFYYTTDVIGSVILLSNNTGAAAATYVYDSFGNTPAPSGGIATTNKLRYAGGWAETDGTTKFGARWYNPLTGTFDQTDPSGQEANNYGYAGGNPITNSDPTGLSFGDFLKGAAFIVGIVSDFLPSTGGVVGGIASGALDAAGDLANGKSWPMRVNLL